MLGRVAVFGEGDPGIGFATLVDFHAETEGGAESGFGEGIWEASASGVEPGGDFVGEETVEGEEVLEGREGEGGADGGEVDCFLVNFASYNVEERQELGPHGIVCSVGTAAESLTMYTSKPVNEKSLIINIPSQIILNLLVHR